MSRDARAGDAGDCNHPAVMNARHAVGMHVAGMPGRPGATADRSSRGARYDDHIQRHEPNNVVTLETPGGGGYGTEPRSTC